VKTKIEAVRADEFAATLDHPIFWYAGNGAPAGRSIAILDSTQLPVDLSEVEGIVDERGNFEAANMTDGPGACDWKFSDFSGNTIYKIQIFSDAKIWNEQNAE